LNMKSLAFDGLVELYDETRVFDAGCFDSALGFLKERFPPQIFRRLLEPGIGTGRIALPLAQNGYQVFGVDISGEMLAELKRRLAQSPAASMIPVSFHRADVTALPFPGGAFDMVVAVHLFYFIPLWKQAVDEILRVTHQGGAIVLLHTGTGAEIPFLNERYKALCGELGCPVREIGVKSTRDVVDYLGACGCQTEWIRDRRWSWTARISLDMALGYIQRRAYSFTTFAPDAVHRAAVEKLEADMKARYGALNVEIEVPNQIYLVLTRKV
jgi:ubiquinone/menaquinone biosynthesis C-methylase UbiE